MPDVWRIYRVKNCRHTHPPKDKFILVVCHDKEFMAFLINSEINQFIVKRPHLLASQILFKRAEHGFLFHDSYLDCSRIYPFSDSDLNVGLEIVDEQTKIEIRNAVSESKTIELRYMKLIISN
jgi:hypothetical protein